MNSSMNLFCLRNIISCWSFEFCKAEPSTILVHLLYLIMTYVSSIKGQILLVVIRTEITWRWKIEFCILSFAVAWYVSSQLLLLLTYIQHTTPELFNLKGQFLFVLYCSCNAVYYNMLFLTWLRALTIITNWSLAQPLQWGKIKNNLFIDFSILPQRSLCLFSWFWRLALFECLIDILVFWQRQL